MIANVLTAIDVDQDGVARLGKTRLKLMHLVMAMKSWSLDVNGLRENYPELSLAEIHAALAYYYDNQEVFDEAIRRDLDESAVLERALSDVELCEKLVRQKFGSDA